jgi:hypothetical protein
MNIINLLFFIIYCFILFPSLALKYTDHMDLVTDLKYFYNATGVFFIDNKYRESKIKYILYLMHLAVLNYLVICKS